MSAHLRLSDDEIGRDVWQRYAYANGGTVCTSVERYSPAVVDHLWERLLHDLTGRGPLADVARQDAVRADGQASAQCGPEARSQVVPSPRPRHPFPPGRP